MTVMAIALNNALVLVAALMAAGVALMATWPSKPVALAGLFLFLGGLLLLVAR